MPSKRYALENGGRPRLLLSWGAGWSDFTAYVDGDEIGRIEGGRSALKKGRLISLPTGGAIKVELVPGLYSDAVRASRSGTPLPVNDPHARIRQTSTMLLVFGVVAMAFGAIGVLFRAAQATPDFLNIATILFALGAVYTALGYAVRRWRSAPALGLAAGIFLSLVAADWATRSEFKLYDAFVGVAATVLVLWILWRGFTAIGDAKQLDADEPQHATASR